MSVQLTKEECEAIYETVAYLSGHNPEYVFAYYSCGEEDDPSDPTTSAFAKIYACAGRQIPPNLHQVGDE